MSSSFGSSAPPYDGDGSGYDPRMQSQRFNSFDNYDADSVKDSAADSYGAGDEVFSSQAAPETPSPPSVHSAAGGFAAFSAEQNGEGFGGGFGGSDGVLGEGLALREWRRQNAIRLEEKEKKEKEMRMQIIEEADEYKLQFYKKREVNVENKKASNREREKVEKFNGSNFFLWKLKIKAILRKENCLDAIEGRSAGIADDKWEEMDSNAVATLHLTMADSVLSSISEKTTAKEIWDALTKLYEPKSLHNKILLKRRLYTLRMSESTSVTDHINTLNTLFSQLTTMGCHIVENERAELLLQSLPDSYDNLIINITNNNIVDQLQFDYVAAAILEEESRRKNKDNQAVCSRQGRPLLVVRGRSTECDSSGSQSRTRSKSQKRNNFTCCNCGKKGHLKKNCWFNKKGT